MDLATQRERTPVLPIPEDKAEARVAIAKDVIEHVRSNMLNARTGTYFGIQYDRVPAWTRGSFESVVLAIRNGRSRARCDVCAVGAVMVSAIGLYDDADVLDGSWKEVTGVAEDYYDGGDALVVDDDKLKRVARRWFTRGQLDLIECAFERSDSFCGGGSAFASREAAKRFGECFGDANRRLIAIFQNIADNGGRFCP